jgi:hypothetical protein
MDLFKNVTVLSLEQATVLPYLTYRLAMDGCRVIRRVQGTEHILNLSDGASKKTVYLHLY